MYLICLNGYYADIKKVFNVNYKLQMVLIEYNLLRSSK